LDETNYDLNSNNVPL